MRFPTYYDAGTVFLSSAARHFSAQMVAEHFDAQADEDEPGPRFQVERGEAVQPPGQEEACRRAQEGGEADGGGGKKNGVEGGGGAALGRGEIDADARHQRVYAGGNSHGQKSGQRQAGDVGHLLFFVTVVPALADDVDPQEGEDDKAQPVVPGRNVLVHGSREQEAKHGHQELSRPGGEGKLDSVAQTFLLNEQAVGERHDKGVYGQGESQE